MINHSTSKDVLHDGMKEFSVLWKNSALSSDQIFPQQQFQNALMRSNTQHFSLPPWLPMSLSSCSRRQRSLSAPLPSTHRLHTGSEVAPCKHWVPYVLVIFTSLLCFLPPLILTLISGTVILNTCLKCTKKRSSFYFSIWMNTPGASLLFLWHYELFSFSGYILFPLGPILVPKFLPVHFFSSFTISYINSVKLPLHFKVDVLSNFTFVQLLQPQESLLKPAPAPAVIPSYETQS